MESIAQYLDLPGSTDTFVPQRTSLDDVLDSWQGRLPESDAHSVHPSNLSGTSSHPSDELYRPPSNPASIPLPPSRSASPSSSLNALKSNVNQPTDRERRPPTARRRRRRPERREAGGSQEPLRIPEGFPRAPPQRTYLQTVTEIARQLPYLGIVASDDCRDQNAGSMLVFDYDTQESLIYRTYRGRTLPNGALWGDMPPDYYIRDVPNIRNVPPNVATRLIVLEDLSSAVIEILGSALGIRPEAFEAHLRNSGYERTRSTDVSNQSRTWKRFDSSQLYDSLTWFRPVLPTLSISDGKYKDIWADRNPRLPCLYPNCTRENHKVATKRNVLRNRFTFSILNGTENPEHFPIGWEERITIWRRKIGHCRFGTSNQRSRLLSLPL
jgi:hypothetical protein